MMSDLKHGIRTGSGRGVVEVRDLGFLGYGEALELQRQVQREVIEGREQGGRAGVILLVEHDPPVITVSRRPGARMHLTASEAQLHEAGVTVAETDRGGDITYHGPGQLVVYPILDLNVYDLRIHSYMRLLEEVAIATLSAFGIAGQRDPSATGVWVGEGAAARKICAMGVRVSRWVSMHGLALNVNTDLSHFGLIVPCGLVGRNVTSMERERGERVAMAEVKDVLVERMVGRL